MTRLTTMAAMPASTALAIGDDIMSASGFDLALVPEARCRREYPGAGLAFDSRTRCRAEPARQPSASVQSVPRRPGPLTSRWIAVSTVSLVCWRYTLPWQRTKAGYRSSWQKDRKRAHHSFHSLGFFLKSASYCNGVRLTSITGEGRGLIYWPQSRIGSEEHLR